MQFNMSGRQTLSLLSIPSLTLTSIIVVEDMSLNTGSILKLNLAECHLIRFPVPPMQIHAATQSCSDLDLEIIAQDYALPYANNPLHRGLKLPRSRALQV